MVDRTRPFVSGRMSFLVLFSGGELTLTKAEIADVADMALRNLSGVFVTRITTKNTPPQTKIILNQSNLTAENVSGVARRLESEFDNKGASVQTIQAVATVMGPADKVRGVIE